MAKTNPSSEVAVVENKGLIVAPSFMDDADFGGGFEGADKDSFAIPFLQVLQKMSPLVDEDNPRYVQGAKAGMLYNTVSQKLYDGKEGVTIIPCAFKRSFIQWGGREGDGGFKGEFTPEQFAAMVEDEKKVITLEGRHFKPNEDGSVNEKKNDYFADTRSHFILIVEPNGEISRAILSLSSTQMKASKMLMTALQNKRIERNGVKVMPPTFANLVKLTTVGQSNDKGSWSGARFDLTGLVTDASMFAEAKDFYKAIVAGDVKVDYAKQEAPPAGEVSETPKDAEGF